MAAEMGTIPRGPEGRARFNEAAAEWPRKYATSDAGTSTAGCFNEAAAEWPREYPPPCSAWVRRPSLQ